MILLFRLYVRFIRKHTEKKLNELFEKIQPTKSTMWAVFKNLPMQEFSDKINSYEYKPDLGEGLVDYARDNPNAFFDNLTFGRDCDDWARLWKHWGIHNGYTVQEVIISTKQHVVKDAHVVCVLEKDNSYWMCDYKPYGAYASLEQAVEGIPDHWKKYTHENMVYELYTAL